MKILENNQQLAEAVQVFQQRDADPDVVASCRGIVFHFALWGKENRHVNRRSASWVKSLGKSKTVYVVAQLNVSLFREQQRKVVDSLPGDMSNVRRQRNTIIMFVIFAPNIYVPFKFISKFISLKYSLFCYSLVFCVTSDIGPHISYSLLIW